MHSATSGNRITDASRVSCKGEMPHQKSISENYETLKRCTAIDSSVIFSLWSAKAIDSATKSRLEAERSTHDRCVRLYEWLMEQPTAYKRFLKVMTSDNQLHVAKLLKGENNGIHVPLSAERHERLRSICSDLLWTIHNSPELVSILEENAALSKADCEELKMDRTNYKLNSILINAILRRSNYSFDCLESALRKTHQGHIAAFLKEGQIVRVHLETSRPDLDETLSQALNENILQESTNPSEDSLFSEHNTDGIHILQSKPDHSILVFIYCKKPENMVKFAELYDKNGLNMTNIMNNLLQKIHPENQIPLYVNPRVEDEDVLRVQEFTGLEDWMMDRFRSKKSNSRSHHVAGKYLATKELPPIRRLPTSRSDEQKLDDNAHHEARIRELERELLQKENKWAEEKKKLLEKQIKQESLSKQMAIISMRSGSSEHARTCHEESDKLKSFLRSI